MGNIHVDVFIIKGLKEAKLNIEIVFWAVIYIKGKFIFSYMIVVSRIGEVVPGTDEDIVIIS